MYVSWPGAVTVGECDQWPAVFVGQVNQTTQFSLVPIALRSVEHTAVVGGRHHTPAGNSPSAGNESVGCGRIVRVARRSREKPVFHEAAGVQETFETLAGRQASGVVRGRCGIVSIQGLSTRVDYLSSQLVVQGEVLFFLFARRQDSVDSICFLFSLRVDLLRASRLLSAPDRWPARGRGFSTSARPTPARAPAACIRKWSPEASAPCR